MPSAVAGSGKRSQLRPTSVHDRVTFQPGKDAIVADLHEANVVRTVRRISAEAHAVVQALPEPRLAEAMGGSRAVLDDWTAMPACGAWQKRVDRQARHPSRALMLRKPENRPADLLQALRIT